MKDRRLFPRAVLIAFVGKIFLCSFLLLNLNLATLYQLTPIFINPALLVLYVPMAAVGYFELGEMAR